MSRQRPVPSAEIAKPNGQPCRMVKDLGETDQTRRLSDKVLAAFNHAYSVGETEIANELKGVLAKLEERSGHSNCHQRILSATAQADLWVDFVAARNEYTAMLEREHNADNQLAGALKRMKDCYMRWSHG